MAYSVRSLADLSTEARGFFTQTIPGAIAKVWANTFTIVGKVLALLNFEHEQRRAFLYDQIFVSRAAATWLARHGYEYGLNRGAPSAATGFIVVQAAAGLVVPSALRFGRSDGVTYTTIAGATSTGSTVALPVQADAVGMTGNLGAGFPLSLIEGQTVPAGLGVRALVAESGLAGGADLEAIETWRARILDRKRNPPRGGSSHDYETWAAEALGPGILRKAYVASFENDTRSVWVCFTVNDQPNGIPTPEQVALVQAYVDDPVRRPLTARAFAVAPIELPVDIVIGRLAPDTLDVRAAVETEIAATFTDRAEVGTSSVLAGFSRSWLDEAISRATGEDRHEVIAPAASITASAGQLPVLGAVTYV